jgi:hypothetical protein
VTGNPIDVIPKRSSVGDNSTRRVSTQIDAGFHTRRFCVRPEFLPDTSPFWGTNPRGQAFSPRLLAVQQPLEYALRMRRIEQSSHTR